MQDSEVMNQSPGSDADECLPDNHPNRVERPLKEFDQVKHSARGNLSPLRGSTQWDQVHNDAIKNYAMRSNVDLSQQKPSRSA